MRMRFYSWVTVLLALTSGCAVSLSDPSTAFGRANIATSVNRSLTGGDCSSAYEVLEPWFNSAYSDNQSRLLMASVYGCFAGVNVFSQLGSLAVTPSALSGSGFWRFLAQTFPSSNTPSDRKLETALYGIDAAQSVINPGTVLNPTYSLNLAGFNPQSFVTQDRGNDPNFYLSFLGMAAMGAIENRLGAPNALYVKTVNLPGQTAVTVTTNSCKFAAAAVNFMDGIHSVASVSTGPIGQTLVQLDQGFTAIISGACSLGCTGAAPPAGVASGCALANCVGCPMAMRNTAASCTALATDQNSCAAAGIINFINNNPFGWN